jgi:ferredoxin-NADP reductase
VRIAAEAALRVGYDAFMELTLIERRPEAGDAVSFFFRRPPGLRWTPGQYIGVDLPHADADERGGRRWFTISSAPHEELLRVTTRTFASGSSFKRALLALQPGDSVVADVPRGSFTSPDRSRPHLFLAGGIGITPFRSMLVDLDRTRSGPPVTLVYASRRDVIFRDELEALAARNSWLTVRYVVEPKFVDGSTLREVLGADQVVWISGPEMTVNALHGLVAALGVPAERVKRDEFPGYDEVTGTGTPLRARPTAAAQG